MVLNPVSDLVSRLVDTSHLPLAGEQEPGSGNTHPGWTESGWQAMCRAMYEDWARTYAPVGHPPLAGLLAAASAAVANTALGEYSGCLRTYLLAREPAGEQRWWSAAVLSTGEAIPITAVSQHPWSGVTDPGHQIVAAVAVTVLQPTVGLVADLAVAHASAGALLWQLADMSRSARLLSATAESVADLIGVDRVFETPLPFLLAVGDHEESPT